jgi:hypothetical protein
MVLGIVGLALCWIPFAGWACALVGVILGALGMSKAKKIGGKGKGMAIAGLVCGIIGLAVGVLLFALTMMAMKSFETYVDKSSRREGLLMLRSMETKIKIFYDEKRTLPASGSLMPGPANAACNNGGRIPRKSQAEWDQAGWQEMGFHVDEDSRYAYQWTKKSNTEGVAVASVDLDCDGTPSTTTMTINIVEGNPTATYGEPTED